MILILPFVNFAINFFWVRFLCKGLKLEHTWYVVLGLMVFDLGKAATSDKALPPTTIFLFTIAGMAGSLIGRNEAVKGKTSGDGNE